jgi:hypothetical protein
MSVTFACFGMVESSSASAIVISPNARGWYDAGTNTVNGRSAGNNHAVGHAGTFLARNWFQFDLSSVSEPVTSASLLVSLGGYATDSTFETYSVFDVLSPFGDLGTIYSSTVYDDLGSGVSYGSVSPPYLPAGHPFRPAYIVVTFNAAGVAAINTMLGSEFAVGGAITTLGGGIDSEYLFGFSAATNRSELWLNEEPPPAPLNNPLPEPSTLLLIVGGGVVGIGRRFMRR